MARANAEEGAGSASAGRIWGEAFAELVMAQHEGQLEATDLERLAVAAYMVGRNRECDEAWTDAHHAWLRRGEVECAARCAFWHALGLYFRGDRTQAGEPDVGLRREVAGAVLVRLGCPQRRHLDLRAPAFADFKRPGDVEGRAGRGKRIERLGVFPGDGLGGAGCVAERESQPGVAVAAPPQLALAHSEHLFYLLPILHIAQRHPRRERGLRDYLLLGHCMFKVEAHADGCDTVKRMSHGPA